MLTDILPEIWDDKSLKSKDPFDCKIIQCILPLLKVPEEPGILIPSLFALKQWSKVYNPVIAKFHNYDVTKLHDFTVTEDIPLDKLSDADNDKYIMSSRLRATRNIVGFPHPFNMTQEQRMIVMNAV